MNVKQLQQNNVHYNFHDCAKTERGIHSQISLHFPLKLGNWAKASVSSLPADIHTTFLHNIHDKINVSEMFTGFQ